MMKFPTEWKKKGSKPPTSWFKLVDKPITFWVCKVQGLATDDVTHSEFHQKCFSLLRITHFWLSVVMMMMMTMTA